MIARLLIADDDPEILELLRFTFEAESYGVLAAVDGEEAWQMIRSEHPDLAVLDVNMPKLSGFEVCEKIRENSDTCLLPVVLLTSLAKTKDRITGLKLGADDYLAKPFEPLELVARVEGLLRRARASLAANPLTGLPGTISIESEVRRRTSEKQPFSVVFAQINNLREFNDRFGFQRGDSIVRLMAVIMRTATGQFGTPQDFIGHVASACFAVVTLPDKAAAVAQAIVKDFDVLAVRHYTADASVKGYLQEQDGAAQLPPDALFATTVSITVSDQNAGDYTRISEQAGELLKKGRESGKSGYLG